MEYLSTVTVGRPLCLPQPWGEINWSAGQMGKERPDLVGLAGVMTCTLNTMANYRRFSRALCGVNSCRTAVILLRKTLAYTILYG